MRRDDLALALAGLVGDLVRRLVLAALVAWAVLTIVELRLRVRELEVEADHRRFTRTIEHDPENV
jgi:hypothetical protein